MLAPSESANAPSVASQRAQLIVLIPVYNDWEVLRLLLQQLDAELSANQTSASVVAVNDGSQLSAEFRQPSFNAIRTLEVLHLRRNLGHQRAIAVGLAYVEANFPCA